MSARVHEPHQAAVRDRRRSQRKPYVVEAFIDSPTARDDSERQEIRSVNLSRTGLGFDCAKPLPKDTYYRIEIDMGPQRLTCEIRIISCRPIEEGMYHVGAEFC